MGSKTWPRDLWLGAIWEAQIGDDKHALDVHEWAVAYVYGRYAFARETSEVAWTEILRRTRIKSRTTISRAVQGLVDKGWLVEERSAGQHRSTLYRLTIPTSSSPSPVPLDGAQQSTSCTAERGSSSPSPGASSPSPGASGTRRGLKNSLKNSPKNSNPVLGTLGEHLTRERARETEPDDRCPRCGMTGRTSTGRQRHHGLWCPQHPDHLPAYRRCAETSGDWRCPRTATEGHYCNQHAERR